MSSGPKDINKKPTRRELILELESIRSSLLEDNDGFSHHALHKQPQKTVKKPNGSAKNAVSAHDWSLDKSENSRISNSPKGHDTGNSELIMDDAKTSSHRRRAKQKMETPPKPLPGQQSLFEDSTDNNAKLSTHSLNQSSESPISSLNQANTDFLQSSSDKRAENPFLPEHIRERLNREKKGLRELQSPTKNQEESLHEALIDSLVSKYLPAIEKDLREQLSEMLKNKPIIEKEVDQI